jgi:hypothetical protein
VKGESLTFYDNRPAVDLLMGKPDGIMWMVDEASRTSQGGEFIIGKTIIIKIITNNKMKKISPKRYHLWQKEDAILRRLFRKRVQCCSLHWKSHL